MAWRFHGRAQIDDKNPRALAICDRCGAMYNHYMLRFQYEWRGLKLASTGFLVCPPCYDVPQDQLKPRVLPADPLPIDNPRYENYAADNDAGNTAE